MIWEARGTLFPAFHVHQEQGHNMNNSNRVYAVHSVAARPVPPPLPPRKVELVGYGEDVFGEEAIRQYLSGPVAKKLLATINDGAPLDPAIAGNVAHAMKEWAMSRGATHFTHWFLPLTGSTAEKHDSFLESVGRGQAIMAFSGKNLIVGEPDASSFPSGGLRCTFEARGYTAWDPTSPAFIKRHANGATLCIPTAFCSYTGAALDKKTPLLRSIQALTRSVERFVRAFGKEPERISVTLGLEQEYFLIDRNFYLQRPDLLQTGRTLFGAPPPKHQQLEDHYFGAIRPRVLAFMTEVEQELWRLGIPAKTRHNEAAPAQFELAPMFEEQNLACDHNMLVMEVLRQVAERNGLVCLLHEKPFRGVNGSGKHNNWSVCCGGENLLDPGHDPHRNAMFLAVLCAVIRAVDLHSDLMRAATANAGNDHRLGAAEAPPAIISIFLGDQLSEIVFQLAKAGVAGEGRHVEPMRIGVDTLPSLPRDVSDRNRTSPFAFTGNKFEFRAPGSSQSCSGVNVVLNTIVAESLDYISGQLEKLKPAAFNTGLQKILQKIVSAHQRIIFNGDNYSEEWKQEAARRGLPNYASTLAALPVFRKPENRDLLERYGVLSPTELDSRYEVSIEEYERKMRIEGAIALEIARSMILPVVSSELGRLVASLRDSEGVGLEHGRKGLRAAAEKLGVGLDLLEQRCDALEGVLKGGADGAAVGVAATSLREIVDSLEYIVDDSKWPLPKYREMLFIY